MARPRAFDEDDVVQKALDTFWSRGYGATSVEDLVAATGLSRASLYATFGDKHQLFMRALRQYHQGGCQRLTDLTADPAVPALVQVRRILEMNRQLALSGGDDRRGCLLINAATELLPHDTEASEVAGQSQQFLEDLLTTILARGQERGEVRPTAAPQAQARLLLSVLNGMLVLAKTSADPQVLHDVMATALQALT